MDLGLQDNKVVITGGSKGIGKSIANLMVANAVGFPARPAASWLTGVNLMVDGGSIKRVQL